MRSAIVNSGFAYPAGRLLVNLAPANVRKAGPAFDIAMALALIAMDEQIDRLALQEFIALGELALDGKLQPVSGILPMVLGARNAGFTKLIVPAENADEAALVDGIELYAVDSFSSAIARDLRKRRRNGEPVRTRPNSTRRTSWFTAISVTFADSSARNAPSKSPPPAATTSCSSGRPAAGRRCSRGAFPRSCRR